MKLALAFTALLAFGAPACQHTPPAPPPANVASAPALGEAERARLSSISANAEAAEFANVKQPAGPITRAVAGPLSVIRALAGPATEKDRIAALKLVNLALVGKLVEADAGWTAARTDAAALNARVSELETQVANERTAAAAELSRQLREARDEARRQAEAREKLIITAIFFGLGALCLIGAVTSLALRAYVPMFGLEVSLWLGIAGGVLIGTGILIRAINRLIEDHPFLFWGGLLVAVVGVVGAVFLMRANHHHAKAEAAATP